MMPAMNEQDAAATPEFLRLCAASDMAAHYRAFAAYARRFYTGDAAHDFHLDLKAEHSRNVFAHARDLAREEGVFAASPALSRALLLAGLYHDLGRFPQYARYKTFADPLSVNHAQLSVRECLRGGFLAGEERRVRHMALGAVFLHNRFTLPTVGNKDTILVCKALRDADKLDIMRVMASHLCDDSPDAVVALHVVQSPRFTPAILDAVRCRRLAAYTDMATTTDFALLVCGWLYDLNFPWSRRAAGASGHLATLLASLPENGELAPFKIQFQEDMVRYATSD